MAGKNIKAQTSTERAIARDAKSAADQAKFDKLPISTQLLSGIGVLLIVAVVGFAFLFAIDILFLDLDPIGRLLGFTTGY